MQIINKLPSKKFIEIFAFGVVSGIPFSVLYTALVTYLLNSGFSLSVVTTIGIARISYSFKYIWAPFVDRIKLPLLHIVGRRKSWMLLTTIINLCTLMSFVFIDVEGGFNIIFYLSLILGFSSATFDIAFDAYRIDTTPDKQQALAVANVVTGYRVGVLIASAGSLYFSSFLPWSYCFLLLSIILASATFYIPFLKEENTMEVQDISIIEKIKIAVIHPFAEFFKRRNSILILIAIILYKAGDVLLGFVSIPFYLELGYTKTQIASVVKIFGLLATIFGTFIGAKIVEKIGHLKGLIACGLIQAFVNLMFIWLHYSPVENFSLLLAISIENIGCGAGTAAEVGYLSYLCNKSYSATQYALLSSFAAMLNGTISSQAGFLVEKLGWDYFFASTVLLSFPALVIFLFLELRTKIHTVPRLN